MNNKKVKKRFISIFGAFCVFVSFLFIPVSAAGANGNDFVFKDYVKYTFTDNDTVVNANVSFPDDWIITNVFWGNYPTYFDTYKGAKFSFGTTGTAYNELRLEMLPIGGNAFSGHDVGFQFQDTKIIDLRYVPDSTIVEFRFNVMIESIDIDDNLTLPQTSIVLYFVDSNGKVVYKYTDGFYAGISSVDDMRTLAYHYGLDLAKLNLPVDVVGVVPYMFVSEIFLDFDSIHIEYEPLEFIYSMSALQYESASNQQLQDSIDDVEKALEELATGTPEQNDQAQNAVNDLNGTADKLGDLGDTMSSVEKPVIDSSQISAGSLVPETSLSVLAMPFHALWENDILLAILTIVVTLVLVSWVFFGKKG